MFNQVLKRQAFFLLPVVAVWLIWLAVQGPYQAITNLLAHAQIALTMVIGSIVAGATSMGGGVVAFPVFTKILAIPPYDAKVFSLAIQSVGMGSAALVIYLRDITVEWRVIRWGSAGGLLGILVGLGPLAHVLPPPMLKLSFTLMLSSFAVVLVILNRKPRTPNRRAPRWGNRERAIVVIAGAMGGVLSGMVGTGIDIVLFVVMVLLFRMCETTATPTSVILMAGNALCGFALQVFWLQDFSPTVQGYWLAAIPVVVVGAPLGALLCSFLARHHIAWILIGLIAVELLTTLWLVRVSPDWLYLAAGFVLAWSYLLYRMLRVRDYEPGFTDSAVLREP